jgi:hypothetical protein
LKAFVNREAGFGEFMGATRRRKPTDNFNVSTVWWYVKNTGIPISFGTTVIIGLLVGMAVSCQTFYSFVLENMRHLGALKAMGASNGTLCLMLIVQAFTVGIIGYGIGCWARRALRLERSKMSSRRFTCRSSCPSPFWRSFWASACSPPCWASGA